jgi:DNA polymerase gamma 1
MEKNCLGYPVIKASTKPRPNLDTVVEYLNQLGIKTPIEYDPNVFIPNDLGFPTQSNYLGYFNEVSQSLCGKYLTWIEELHNVDQYPVPPNESQIKLLPGWTVYDSCGNYIGQAEYVDEDVAILDTETYVQGGNYPIIATVTASTRSYVWLAKEFINPDLPQSEWDQFNMVPVGPRLSVIIGHNIGFDLARISESYGYGRRILGLDTLSCSMVVSGFASAQRFLSVVAAKAPEKLTNSEKFILKNRPKWFDRGCTNSLVACYNYHVARVDEWSGESSSPYLTDADKDIRNVFVDTKRMKDFVYTNRLELIEYATKDTYYTAKLFQAVWPKYKIHKPSPILHAGHLLLLTTKVPLVHNWFEWIENCEKLLEDENKKIDSIIKKTAKEIVDKVNSGELDPLTDYYLSQLDWTMMKKKRVPKWYSAMEKKTITSKSDICHILMRLKWKGFPMIKKSGKGWGYVDEQGIFNKVPHKDSLGDNVGNVINKNYVEEMLNGTLTGDHPLVNEVFSTAIRTSFWISSRSRAVERLVKKVQTKHGQSFLMTIPQVIPNGTSTGRSIENLFLVLTSAKENVIGTELKSRITAPPGYKIVSADFSAQELGIASLYADRESGGWLGCSPTTFQVVAGCKANFSDPHSAVAYNLFLKQRGFKLINGEWFVEE